MGWPRGSSGGGGGMAGPGVTPDLSRSMGDDELCHPAEVPGRSPGLLRGGRVVQELAPAGTAGPPGQAPDEDTMWDRGRGGGRGCSCGGWSEALAVAPGVGEVWSSWLPAASV